MGATQVIVVDDDAPARARLVHLLQQHGELVVVAQAADFAQGLAVLAHPGADIALVDLELPGGSGVELIRHLRLRWPDCHVVAVTAFSDSAHVLAAIEAGADGYVVKDTPDDELLGLILSVRSGGSPLSPKVARQILQRLRTAPPAPANASVAPPQPEQTLSERELTVLQLTSKGYTHDEVAQMMGVSRHTVLTYVRRCYRKLQVHSKTEAVYEARRMGVLKD